MEQGLQHHISITKYKSIILKCSSSDERLFALGDEGSFMEELTLVTDLERGTEYFHVQEKRASQVKG